MAAATPVGGQPIQFGDSALNIRYDVIGKNSEVFALNDIVQITSGVLNVGTVTMVGVAVKGQTMTSSNQTVAKVYPGYVPITDDSIFLMGSNADFTGNATDPGTYYSITGATGAQRIDVTKGVVTGVARAVEIVKVDPFGEGTTGVGGGLRKAYVRLIKTPYTNVQITS